MSTANKERKQPESVTAAEQLSSVPLNLIDICDQLVRDDPDDDSIIELATDIQRRGLLQPVAVAPRPGGRYQLLFGCRRLLAHRRLGLPCILARVRDVPPDMVKATALVENIQRQQMTLKEECDAVTHLHLEMELSPDQVGTILSKSRAWVLTRLTVPQLPDDLREPLLEGRLALGSAEALALLDDPGARAFVLQQIAASKLTVSQVRQLVETYQETPEIQAAVAAGVAAAHSPVSTQPILIQCAACGVARKLDDLVLIRVCRDGCVVGECPHEGAQIAH